MKLLKHIMSFAAAAGMLSACTSDLDTVEVLPIENAVPATIHELSEDIVITADNQEEEVVFSWDAADFGARTQIAYSVLAAYEGTTVTLFSGISSTSYAMTKGVLNNRVALPVEEGGLGLPLDEAAPVEFFVGATVGSTYGTVFSNIITVNVTTTAAEKQYPVVWIIGDYCGWNHGASQLLYSFTEDEVNYEGFIDFGDKAANGFKLTGVGGWDDSCNWGTDGDAPAPADEAASITLISSGGSGNISCYSKRFYNFAFNKSTLTLEVKNSFDQLGIVGDGVGSWENDLVMDFNPEKRRFWVDADLVAGEIKFRADADWAVNWGGSDGKLESGAANIKVEAGQVRIYAYLSDSNDLRYELDAKMYGKDEVSDGGGEEPGPDEPEKPEEKPNLWEVIGEVNQTKWEASWISGAAYMVEVGPGVWYSDFIEIGGEFKFRFNNDWNQNLGKGADDLVTDAPYAGVADGGNFSLAPGSYQFALYTETNTIYAFGADAEAWGVIGSIAGDSWSHNWTLFESNGMLAIKGVQLTASTEFKFRKGTDWNVNFGYGAVTPNSVVDGANGGDNITVAEEGVYDLYLDADAGKCYFMKAGVDPSTATAPGKVEIDLTGYAWGICGTITGWAEGADIALTAEGDYAVARGVTVTTADEFKVRADGKWDLSYGSDTVVEIGRGVELTKTQTNIKISANGTYDIYFGLKSACLYVMEEGAAPAL
ncbi:SusE domain-containing protein [uncultured Alistipes sp.]|uniref:SusE domain-containing protein n=1 Tax=uncultured Alistipes sp. TaxID=538949 RepID=UPI00262B33FD|nr:SusE domain-containing protein [uncultured Alistipes sp.]